MNAFGRRHGPVIVAGRGQASCQRRPGAERLMRIPNEGRGALRAVEIAGDRALGADGGKDAISPVLPFDPASGGERRVEGGDGFGAVAEAAPRLPDRAVDGRDRKSVV